MLKFAKFAAFSALFLASLASADPTTFHSIQCLDRDPSAVQPVYMDVTSANTGKQFPYEFSIGHVEQLYPTPDHYKHQVTGGTISSLTIEGGVITILGAFGTKLVIQESVGTSSHPGLLSGPVDIPSTLDVTDYPVNCEIR